MAEKDITEKILLGYNDVAADVVNVLVLAEGASSGRRTCGTASRRPPTKTMIPSGGRSATC